MQCAPGRIHGFEHRLYCFGLVRTLNDPVTQWEGFTLRSIESGIDEVEKRKNIGVTLSAHLVLIAY